LWTRPVPGASDALRALARQGVRIAIVSNSDGTVEQLLRDQDVCQVGPGSGVAVDAIVDSSVVGAAKPDPRIFKYFCDNFDLRPEQIIYIDDLQHNVEAARTIGMHAIRFSDPASLRQELVQLRLLASRAHIEHAAAWVLDLDRARSFYERWFHADSTPEYSSSMREFRSRFLSLDGGSRLELMVSPQETPRHAHIAISVGSRPAVDRLVKEMEQAGVQIVSGPRVTGDGYYEAVIADSEGNLVDA